MKVHKILLCFNYLNYSKKFLKQRIERRNWSAVTGCAVRGCAVRGCAVRGRAVRGCAVRGLTKLKRDSVMSFLDFYPHKTKKYSRK